MAYKCIYIVDVMHNTFSHEYMYIIILWRGEYPTPVYLPTIAPDNTPHR
jgi:hypothetical protein